MIIYLIFLPVKKFDKYKIIKLKEVGAKESKFLIIILPLILNDFSIRIQLLFSSKATFKSLTVEFINFSRFWREGMQICFRLLQNTIWSKAYIPAGARSSNELTWRKIRRSRCVAKWQYACWRWKNALSPDVFFFLF